MGGAGRAIFEELRMIARRWRVVAVLFLLAFITIVDRVCISAAKSHMAADLGISDLSFGYVFGAFALGYALCMMPSGWAADVLGPRRCLTLSVCLWSVFTVATGLVQSLPPLIAVRVLFGGAEAGAFPTAARAIHNWLPVRERGVAMGLLNTGSRLGAALGLAVTTVSISRIGWRMSFALLGAAGWAWAVGWYWWFRDRSPEAAEGSDTRAPMAQNWRELVSLNNALLLIQYFASNFTFFLCFSWLLPYLRSRFGLSATEASIYAGIPLYCGAAATWGSGMVVDKLYRSGRATASRRVPAIAGFSLAAITLMAAGSASNVVMFVALFSVTTFGVDFTLSPSWTACSDIAGARTGTLSGAMNTFGSLGSFLSSICFPWLLSATHDVRAHFFLAALLNVIAAICWWRIRLPSI
jgi:MFS transporter, ACS family, glucarate transporter